ncbi:MAG TPA: hypothetical protein VFC86_04545 [Planctomycetota bacterium]|nr:hypothetical protein [Planctomycetota bacterium]
MKTGAMVLAVVAFALGDVTPKSNAFNPRGLREERTFAAPGLWLLSPGGKYVATSTGGDSFGLIESATGRDLGAFGDHGGAGRHDGNWGASDRFLATTGSDGTVKVWDATTRKEVGSMKPHSGFT